MPKQDPMSDLAAAFGIDLDADIGGGLDIIGADDVDRADHIVRFDMFDERSSVSAIRDHSDIASMADEIGRDAIRDFFTISYRIQPTINDAVTAPLEHRQQFIKEVCETTEHKTLHQQTQLDSTASIVAARHYARQYQLLVRANKDERMRQHSAAVAAYRASRAAQEELESIDAVNKAFGNGAGDGGVVDGKRAMQLWASIRNDARLRRIIELAGRYLRVADAARMAKSSHGQDEVVGITLGDELADMIDDELLALAHPVFRPDFMQRLYQSSVHLWDMEGPMPQSKGDIVVMVDESGSMDSDENILQAKALSLAVLHNARKDRRRVWFVSFAGGNQVEVHRADQDTDIRGWLEHFFRGGTDFEAAFAAGMKVIGDNEHADLMLISDGISSLTESFEQRFMSWKKRTGARLFSTIIGDGVPAQLAHVSDSSWHVSRMSVDGESTVPLLSI